MLLFSSRLFSQASNPPFAKFSLKPSYENPASSSKEQLTFWLKLSFESDFLTKAGTCFFKGSQRFWTISESSRVVASIKSCRSLSSSFAISSLKFLTDKGPLSSSSPVSGFFPSSHLVSPSWASRCTAFVSKFDKQSSEWNDSQELASIGSGLPSI